MSRFRDDGRKLVESGVRRGACPNDLLKGSCFHRCEKKAYDCPDLLKQRAPLETVTQSSTNVAETVQILPTQSARTSPTLHRLHHKPKLCRRCIVRLLSVTVRDRRVGTGTHR